MNLHHWQTHLWHLGQVPCAIKASHALCSLCTKAARRQQLSSEISKITLFLKGAEDKALEKTMLLLRGLLRASFQRCSSNASLPYASSYKSVHQLDQATPSLGVKGFLFSVTHFIPALTVNISKLLSEADHKSAAHLSPAHFLANQYVSTEALMDILSELLTPVHNCSSLLPERNFLGAVPFARQTSLAVENTGNVMGHSGRTVAITAERGEVCEDC